MTYNVASCSEMILLSIVFVKFVRERSYTISEDGPEVFMEAVINVK